MTAIYKRQPACNSRSTTVSQHSGTHHTGNNKKQKTDHLDNAGIHGRIMLAGKHNGFYILRA